MIQSIGRMLGMYSGDVFNPHLLLRYGFTQDLFECFSSLKYLHVELPLLMVRPYHVLIREQVDQRLGNLCIFT